MRVIKPSAAIVLATLAAMSASADTTRSIVVNGTPRTYIVHEPPTGSEGAALVLAFHGGGGSADGVRALSLLSDASDRHGFVVVYPDAVDGTWGTFRDETGDPAGDLAFIDALVPSLATDLGIDQSRVYATGLSNGGEFTFLLGLTRPQTFAAIAPIGMSITTAIAANVSPTAPMPALSIVGFDDPLVLYEGGPIQTPSGPRGDVLSSDESMAFLVKLNGAGPPIRTPLPNPADDGTIAVRDTYGPTLQRITVFGGGHTWPGGVQYLPESLIGRTSRDFSANDVMWAFFQSVSHACVADVNADGVVSPADFNAWVQSFNARSSRCDQNADGFCSAQDFTAWILNYNTGCP